MHIYVSVYRGELDSIGISLIQLCLWEKYSKLKIKSKIIQWVSLAKRLHIRLWFNYSMLNPYSSLDEYLDMVYKYLKLYH